MRDACRLLFVCWWRTVSRPCLSVTRLTRRRQGPRIGALAGSFRAEVSVGLSSRGRALLGLVATGLLLLAVPAPARAQASCDLQPDYNCNAPEYADGHCQQCSSR